jgi:glycosyltransferase involved in cell wall biosynthesis
MFIIPNGVNPEIFKPDPEGGKRVRQKFGILDDEILVSCLKTLQTDDFERVIEAVSKIKEKNVRLLMPWRDKKIPLKKIAEKKGMNNMILVDFIPYSETPAYYSASDIMVIPYVKKEYYLGDLKMFDMQPNSLKEMCMMGYVSTTNLTVMESFACETPTVVCVPGAKISASEHDIGVAAPAWDAQKLAEAIEIIINDRELGEKMGKNARRFVSENFTWEKIAEKTSEVYEKVLD